MLIILRQVLTPRQQQRTRPLQSDTAMADRAQLIACIAVCVLVVGASADASQTRQSRALKTANAGANDYFPPGAGAPAYERCKVNCKVNACFDCCAGNMDVPSQGYSICVKECFTPGGCGNAGCGLGCKGRRLLWDATSSVAGRSLTSANAAPANGICPVDCSVHPCLTCCAGKVTSGTWGSFFEDCVKQCFDVGCDKVVIHSAGAFDPSLADSGIDDPRATPTASSP